MGSPGGWFTNCRVVAAGPAENSKIYIRLSEAAKAWPDRWFEAVEPFEKEMLATALTALTLDHKVTVKLTTVDEYGVIERFYVSNERFKPALPPPPPPPPPPPAGKAAVPDVTELIVGAASKAIKDAGFVAKVSGSQSASAWVQKQSPAGGTLASLGSTVTLTVQTGPQP